MMQVNFMFRFGWLMAFVMTLVIALQREFQSLRGLRRLHRRMCFMIKNEFPSRSWLVQQTGSFGFVLHVTKTHTIMLLHVTTTDKEKTMISSVSDRVQKHRAGLRASGLRLVQIWVPDSRRPGFADECRCQSRQLLNDPLEQETLEWLAAAADTDGWE